MPFMHREEHVDEGMLIIQANLDDMNPEHCPYVTDRLLEAGANDVYWIPILMKKGRPGLMLNVLTDEAKLGDLESIIFTETSTLGLRYVRAACHRLARSFEPVETPWGTVSVKVGRYKGDLVQFAPENRDCERLAREHNVPLKAVYEEARRGFLASRDGKVDGADESGGTNRSGR
ncbi:hypothetical protein J31TS4_40880 [Paenibacillus sp. J31TS4]|uniref:nickel insertion protein n=1 Tax=Paenibacillus sp. J31TS4 TaxID=2807195 RepID=UPI001B0F100F|nr:nickel insertion protein [Paenibacillus sp. J31TS4]GIP40808.1 hypothetical protein J31TS4_40880 [Paenibacillus sp. J31TS4]